MNPFLEAERARKRESLLAATEADLEKIAAACARARRPLRGQDKIALRADRVSNRRKVGKHFTIDIGDDQFSYPGTRTPSPPRPPWTASTCCAPASSPATWTPGEVVSSYKALAQVERAFRAFSTDLDIRPDPAPHRGPGPRARVPADAVVLHHLAHARPARARCCSPTTTSPPPRPPGPARSPPPPAPRRPWPRPPPSAPTAASRCTASPACSPTWPPSA